MSDQENKGFGGPNDVPFGGITYVDPSLGADYAVSGMGSGNFHEGSLPPGSGLYASDDANNPGNQIQNVTQVDITIPASGGPPETKYFLTVTAPMVSGSTPAYYITSLSLAIPQNQKSGTIVYTLEDAPE